MRRFLLFFSYIGTGFRGVQRLVPRHMKTNLTTPAVTEVIEDALKRRLDLESLPILRTASRTDAGVHAIRTAATVDLDLPNLPPDAITVSLNHYFCKIQCPIRILSTQVVRPDFNARGLPLARSYLYRFAVQKENSGFQSDFSFTHLVPTPIQEYKRCHFVHDCDFDIAAVQAVLPLFNGVKDFASFMSKIKGTREEPPATTIRSLDSVILEPGQPLMPGYSCDQYFDYWQVKIVGKSFLYKQIRRTVAVLLGVGQGRLDYTNVESLFTHPGTWFDCVRSLPAYGLYLTDLVYSKEDLEAPAEGAEDTVTVRGSLVDGEKVTAKVKGLAEEEEQEEEKEEEGVKVEDCKGAGSTQVKNRDSLDTTSKVIPKLKVTSSVTPKDTAQLSINEKINLRQSRLRLERRRATERDSRRKLSTRHALWLAKSKYAKGLEEI